MCLNGTYVLFQNSDQKHIDKGQPVANLFWKEGGSILLVSFRSRFPEVWNKSCEKCFLCFWWYKKQKKNHENSRGKILTWFNPKRLLPWVKGEGQFSCQLLRTWIGCFSVKYDSIFFSSRVRGSHETRTLTYNGKQI